MNQETNTLHKMIPIRLDSNLSLRLDEISKDTRIPKNTIVKLSIDKFITEFDLSGTREKFKELCQL
jgi:predicted DNA-binding protein